MLKISGDGYQLGIDPKDDLPSEHTILALMHGVFGLRSTEQLAAWKNKIGYNKKTNTTDISFSTDDAHFEVQLSHPKKVTLKDFFHQRFQ